MEYEWEYTGHGERPWGEEFHTVRVGKKHEFFVAPDGEHFETILDLLFSYRLGVKHHEDVMEHAELLLKVLRKVPSSSTTPCPDLTLELFAGRRIAYEAYMNWLVQVDLADEWGDLSRLAITNEGRAVLRELERQFAAFQPRTSPEPAAGKTSRRRVMMG